MKVVVVDFESWPEIFDGLAALARAQDRTIEGQIRWMVRERLDSLGTAEAALRDFEEAASYNLATAAAVREQGAAQ